MSLSLYWPVRAASMAAWLLLPSEMYSAMPSIHQTVGWDVASVKSPAMSKRPSM